MPEPGLAKLTLTQKQSKVLEFIQRYLREHRQSPLIREIQLGCEIASYKSAIDRLNSLERKGFIRRMPNKHRSIRIAKRFLESAPVATGAVENPPKAEVPPLAQMDEVSREAVG